MKQFLGRHWFLVSLGLGIGTAIAWPDLLRAPVRLLSPRLLVLCALFLMACTLESRRVWQALVRPWPALWAVFISFGLLPPLAWLLGGLLQETDLRLGLFLMAVAPCTLASAVLWTRLAGGHEAVALLVVVATTTFNCLVAPAWLGITPVETKLDLNPAEMMAELAVVLILPVALGQLSRSLPPVARRLDRWRLGLGIVSQVLILAVIVKAAVDVRDRLAQEGVSPAAGSLAASAVLGLLLHLAALVGGYGGGRAMGFDRPSCIAVAFSCSQKSLPIALFLFDRYFKTDYPLAVVPMTCYHVAQLIVDTFIAERMLNQQREKPP